MKKFEAQASQADLLAKVAPEGFKAHSFALDLYLVNVPTLSNLATRIMTIDGGWVEFNAQSASVRTWGSVGAAQTIAKALADAVGGSAYHLSSIASLSADEYSLTVTDISDSTLKILLKWWTMKGYTAIAGPDGCWVNAGHARMIDMNGRMAIHGGLTDEAVTAVMLKSREQWDRRLYLDEFWTRAEKDYLSIVAMRAAVQIGGRE